MILQIERGISPNGNTLYFNVTSTIPDRNTFAVVAYAHHKKSTGNVVVSPAEYLAETVFSFAFDVTSADGVYKIFVFAVPIYSETGTYEEGDVVYDVLARKIKKKEGDSFVEIAITSLSVQTTTHQGEKLAHVSTQATIIRDQLLLKMLAKQEDLDQNCCEYQDFLKAQTNYNYVRALRSGSVIDFCAHNLINSAKKIERAVSFGLKALEQE
jgi:hypothetical protein